MRQGVKAGCIALAAATIALCAGCQNAPTNLKEAYADYFPIGVALGYESYDYYSDEIYANFSSVTCENSMKWESLEGKEGTFTYMAADEIVEFAKSKDMLVRGHTILWHRQAPSWIFVEENDAGEQVTASIATLKERITDYVENVVGHFKDDVYAWDVVNEVLSDFGYFYRDCEDTNTSENYSDWYRCVREEVVREICEETGETYYPAIGNDAMKNEEGYRPLTSEERAQVDDAFTDLLAFLFKEVKRVDPDCKLFYNDYNLTIPARRNACLEMLKRLEAKGAQIDGVGEQGHYSIYEYNGELLEQAIKTYTEAGYLFQITELDISMYSSGDYRPNSATEPTQEQLDLQKQTYADIFRILREYSDMVDCVTLWGVADDHTWLDNWPVANRKNWPLLFDVYGEPKDCYYAILNFEEE